MHFIRRKLHEIYHPHLEEAFGTSTACVDDPLWDTLAVKIGELLDKVVVFKENGPSVTNSQGGVVIPDWLPGIGSPVWRIVSG